MRIAAPVIETVPLARLQPWGMNPRKNHAVAAIAKSIESFGYLSPIIVQKDTYRVLAGHGRLEALKSKGVTEVPVILADVDDARADLYTLTDNKLTELADWDFPKMAELLLDFDSRNLDVGLTGFSEAELERIATYTPKDLEGAETLPLGEAGDNIFPGGPPPELGSNVKMAALYLTTETFPEFQRMVEKLNTLYGTRNATDCVMEALKRATAELS